MVAKPGAEPSQIASEIGIAGCATPSDLPSDDVIETEIQLLKAIGSPTRLKAMRIIDRADEPVCVCELEPVLDVSQGAVSQSLSTLTDAGLLSRKKDGRWRYYSTTTKATRLLEALEAVREVNRE